MPLYPECLFFYSLVAPKFNGETSLIRSDLCYEEINKLQPEFCSKLEQHGVVYNRVIPGDDDITSPVGRGWKATFQAKDEQTALKNAKNLGVNLEWLPNGDVKTVSPILPGIKEIKKNGRKVWFNSIVAAYTGCKDSRNEPKKSVVFGNGEYLPDEGLKAAVDVMDKFNVSIPWKEGDVVWIDNNQVLHSRRPNFPLPRKILAYLGANCPYTE